MYFKVILMGIYKYITVSPGQEFLNIEYYKLCLPFLWFLSQMKEM